ncbi:MAG TPA: hypothetical protein VHL31_26410 [Geminicoccus sp.]|uniref:hypothetical protein n=1 Tax=Geminicoccus sp. TaxID=2024832 RepID=UPI002E2F5697|nr:hypothetical protein [Geminicoccus sp.]HEX2529811.1 hypothetical protein [Geminicoccus sp.]
MTILNRTARTPVATRIARVDRQRFNEAVAGGLYPCAPSTVSGTPRIFDVNDIVILVVWSELLKEGLPPRKAGGIACGLRSLLIEHPEAERVVFVINSYGRSIWDLRENIPLEANTIGGTFIVSIKEWFLGPIRARVVRELEEEAGTVGTADDE